GVQGQQVAAGECCVKEGVAQEPAEVRGLLPQRGFQHQPQRDGRGANHLTTCSRLRSFISSAICRIIFRLSGDAPAHLRLRPDSSWNRNANSACVRFTTRNGINNRKSSAAWRVLQTKRY